MMKNTWSVYFYYIYVLSSNFNTVMYYVKVPSKSLLITKLCVCVEYNHF